MADGGGRADGWSSDGLTLRPADQDGLLAAVAAGVVTVVSPSGELTNAVRVVLATGDLVAGITDWEVRHRPTLDIAVLGLDIDPDQVDANHVHVVLVDVHHDEVWSHVGEVVAVAPSAEVVLVVDDASWHARTRSLEVGAADVLQRDGVSDPGVLAALLTNVLERAVLRRERDAAVARAAHEAELRRMLVASDGTPVSRTMLGAALLSERSPAFWKRVVTEYHSVLQLSVEQLHFRVVGDPSGRLRALAELLCWAQAGPNDVVELHQVAIGELLTDVDAAERPNLVGELRLRLLELMGAMMNLYRGQSINRGSEG